MLIIAERIIAYLKADATLVALLGSNQNIYIENTPLRKQKYIVIPTRVGADQNNIPADFDTIDITIAVTRNIADASDACLEIVEVVDDLMNKGEVGLTSGDFKIINFCRSDSTGLQFDDKNEEYWYTLSYDYILDKST